MNTVLMRWYTKENGEKVKALQGKIFELGEKLIYYRDLSEHHGRLWKHEGAWNLDARTYDFIKNAGVNEIHYYWKVNRKLYTTTPATIDSWIKRGKVEHEKLNGHTQLFISKEMFKEGKRHYSPPWCYNETDVSNFKIEHIPDITREQYFSNIGRLVEIARSKGLTLNK